jgi:hypothetical protein
VEVLGGDAVGELVQVRLADVRIAGRLEQPHRVRRLGRHVIREDGRAVGRADTGRVEEILDREPDPGTGLGDLGDEDAVYVPVVP